VPLLVGHPWQILHVHMDESGLIVLEGLPGACLFLLGKKYLEIRDPMALEAPVEPGSGGIGIDELPCYHQKIVYGKEKTLPQLHDDLLLDGTELSVVFILCGGGRDRLVPPCFSISGRYLS